MQTLTETISKPRRVFLLHCLAGLAATGAGLDEAKAAERLDPADPYARTSGFRTNTDEVDESRYPRHTKEQCCKACKLWNGGDKDLGNCSFFDGAITPKTGWCKNFKLPKSPAA